MRAKDVETTFKVRFKKSRASSDNGSCVEAALPAGWPSVFTADSKEENGETLEVPRSCWQNFVATIKRGELDK